QLCLLKGPRLPGLPEDGPRQAGCPRFACAKRPEQWCDGAADKKACSRGRVHGFCARSEGMIVHSISWWCKNGASHRKNVVAVGIRLSPYPPRGSVRADFPHTALASGSDAQTARGIRMADTGRRQPAADEPLHSLPQYATFLAPSSQDVVPEVAHGETKMSQSISVARYSEVTEMPTHHGLQPLADFRNRVMHASPQFGFHRQQLGLHAFANRLPKHQKPSLFRLPANVLEGEKIEGLRLAQTDALSVLRRMASELEESRLYRLQSQRELLHAYVKFLPKLIGLVFEVESNHDVVGITHHDYIAARPLPSPCLDPEIEDIMEVDIRQQRRCTSTLWRTCFHERSLALFQHARVQPFLDEPHDAPVRYPMLEEPDQPCVRQPIEKAAHVQVQHPVHTSLMKSTEQGIQRFMLAATWPEPIRE